MNKSFPSISLLVLVIMLIGGAGCGTPPTEQANYAQNEGSDSQWLEGANKPPSEATLFAMAKILVDQGKDEQAQFLLDKTIHDHPAYAPAYVELAEVYMRRRNVDTAIEVLTAGLRASPHNAVLLNDIGMCHVVRGQYEPALAMFQQAVAAMPRDIRYRTNVAMALGMMGRYDEALALYEQTLQPQDAHYNLAILCEARQDSARAAVEFDLAKKLDTTSARPHAATAPVATASPPTRPAVAGS